jgi:hypothetical protein
MDKLPHFGEQLAVVACEFSALNSADVHLVSVYLRGLLDLGFQVELIGPDLQPEFGATLFSGVMTDRFQTKQVPVASIASYLGGSGLLFYLCVGVEVLSGNPGRVGFVLHRNDTVSPLDSDLQIKMASTFQAVVCPSEPIRREVAAFWRYDPRRIFSRPPPPFHERSGHVSKTVTETKRIVCLIPCDAIDAPHIHLILGAFDEASIINRQVSYWQLVFISVRGEQPDSRIEQAIRSFESSSNIANRAQVDAAAFEPSDVCAVLAPGFCGHGSNLRKTDVLLNMTSYVLKAIESGIIPIVHEEFVGAVGFRPGFDGFSFYDRASLRDCFLSVSELSAIGDVSCQQDTSPKTTRALTQSQFTRDLLALLLSCLRQA